jgi:predicted lipoprotein with Yx(FWY)xxD motif
MSPKLLGRPTDFVFVLGIIALLALVGGSNAGAHDRGTQPTADNAQAAPTLTVRKTRFGTVLFDARGRVLYGFTRDRRSRPSQCYGACAAAWPVYYARGTLRAGKGAKQSLIGTTRRRDGRRQVTYNGWPLYYYVDDGVGEVKCQNVDEFGGLWLVVRPSGQLVR